MLVRASPSSVLVDAIVLEVIRDRLWLREDFTLGKRHKRRLIQVREDVGRGDREVHEG
jgi:hypothetical protein